LKHRAQSTAAANDPDDATIFLLQSRFSLKNKGISPTIKNMIDLGDDQLAGRIWCVSEAVVRGEFVAIDTSSNDAFFSQVTDCLELGSVMAVVHLPRINRDQIRVYRNGLGDPDCVEVIELNSPVNLETILRVIDKVHEERLVTPDAQDSHNKLWEKATKWWPIEDAELGVQSHLHSGLSAALIGCTIRPEQPSPVGRHDLLIEESCPTPGLVMIHAILELKVIRSFGSTGRTCSDAENLKWMKSGVKQALTYQKKRSAKECALCCFDMRKDPTDDSDFNQVESLAAKHTVVFRRWILWNSSAAYRDHLVSDD